MTTISEYYLAQFSAEGTYVLGSIFPGWLAFFIEIETFLNTQRTEESPSKEDGEVLV